MLSKQLENKQLWRKYPEIGPAVGTEEFVVTWTHSMSSMQERCLSWAIHLTKIRIQTMTEALDLNLPTKRLQNKNRRKCR